MQRNVMRSIRVAFLLSIAFALLGGDVGEAKNLNNKLKGDYAFSLTQTCSSGSLANDPGGGNVFEDPPSLLLRGPRGRIVLVYQGIAHYNRDGTGSWTGRNVVLLDNVGTPGSSPIRQNGFRCDIEYEVNPDRSFTQRLLNCTFTRLAGAGVDLPKRLEPDEIVLQGQISRGGKILVLGDTDVNFENTTVTSVRITDYQRICGGSGNAVKVK